MPDEKFDEKDREKREEKSSQEKSWEEKYRRDPVSSVVWAGVLVWAGLVLLASNLGFFGGFLGEGEIQFPGLNVAVVRDLDRRRLTFAGRRGRPAAAS